MERDEGQEGFINDRRDDSQADRENKWDSLEEEKLDQDDDQKDFPIKKRKKTHKTKFFY